MKPGLQPGMSIIRRLTVDRDRTIDFRGEESRVYGAPNVVRDIEQICRDLILEHADAGEDSVGTGIAVTHFAAIPLGMDVEITAKVVAVDGQKVALEVAARDDIEPIATVGHNRFVADVAMACERQEQKLAKRANIVPD
jgi:fluoroacetyl-CoA thioesterase